MKGVIFRLFEEFVTSNWGDEFFEDVLASTKLVTQEPFVGPGTYPDEDLLALLDNAVTRLGVSPAEALTGFGRFAFPRLAASFPVFVQGHVHPKSFLQSVDSVIHVEVRKLYPEAVTPRVLIQDTGPDQAILRYESPRKLCALLCGLLEGVGDHFGTPLQFSQSRCALRGDPFCEFAIQFGMRGAPPHERSRPQEAARTS